MCRIILTYETAAARSVVAQKRGFPAHFVIRQGQGLNRIVKSHIRAPLAEMKQAILDDVAAWRQGPATDDVSMVLVEVG